MTSDWPKLAEEIRNNIRMKRFKVAKKAASKGASPAPTKSAAAAGIMVAAAEKAAAEIQIWVQSQTDPIAEIFRIEPMAFVGTVNTSAGWRKVTLNSGHELTWEGEVRASARGKLLFGFKPEMNSELENRGATMVEIPHDELGVVFADKFDSWLAHEMGVASLQELIDQAHAVVDPIEIANAQAKLEAERQKAEEAKRAEEAKQLESNPMFGAWA